MANIKTVVDIFETTANAMAGLYHFNYGERSDINVDRDAEYPRLIVDRNANIQSWDMVKNQTTITFIFQFYGLYHRDAEAERTDQNKQFALSLLAYQYFREIRERFKATNKIQLIDNTVINGNYQVPVANDRLIRLTLNVKVMIIGEC